MNSRIERLMAGQRGLVTRRQAVESGFPADLVDRLVHTGVWVAVRRGVYAEAAAWSGLTSWQDVQLVRDRAASLRISRPHVMSHSSAALELGMQILRPPDSTTHVTRPGIVGAHLRHGVKHHLAPYRLDQRVELDEVAVLDPARTAADIARELGYLPGLVAFDSAFRVGATSSQLHAAVAAMRYWPGVTVVRAARDAADPDSDSVAETLGRDLVEELGHGRPQTQFGITDGRRTAWVDLRLGRHLIEIDGQLKYQRAEDAGLALVDPQDVVWHEKQRQDWLPGFKLGMSRLVWSDVWGPGRAAAKERLGREYLDTCRRFGTSIEDLAPYLVHTPRRRAG